MLSPTWISSSVCVCGGGIESVSRGVFTRDKQEMSQSCDECPQRNWSSIRHI